MKVKVYTVLPEDAKRIRETVFLDEQGFSTEFDDIDDVALHLVGYEDDEPAAVCRLFPGKPGETVLGRLAVRKPYRGAGRGSEMLRFAEAVARERGSERIVLHAQCRAAEFYGKSGYEGYGEIEDDEGVPHIWMKKEL